jgi:hypothetical protein
VNIRSLKGGLLDGNFKGTLQIEVRFSESAGVQMGWQCYRTSRRINISLWREE